MEELRDPRLLGLMTVKQVDVKLLDGQSDPDQEDKVVLLVHGRDENREPCSIALVFKSKEALWKIPEINSKVRWLVLSES